MVSDGLGRHFSTRFTPEKNKIDRCPRYFLFFDLPQPQSHLSTPNCTLITLQFNPNELNLGKPQAAFKKN
jgi:hypothetical protein